MKYYYNLLGLKQDATPQEIKKVYKKLYSKYENYYELPEGRNERNKHFAEWVMIEEAYKVLSDPNNRAAYDDQLATINMHSISEARLAINNDKNYGKSALEMLDIMAYFLPQNIPISVFLELLYCTSSSQEILACSIKLLAEHDLGFLKVEQEEFLFDIYSVTQHNIRSMLKNRGVEEAVLGKATDILEGTVWNLVEHKKETKVMNLILPHVDYISYHIVEYPRLYRRCSRLYRIISNLIQKEIRYTGN